jgi:DNA-binding GntR family transcriptional regulator
MHWGPAPCRYARQCVNWLAAEGALEILPNRAMRVPLMTKGKFSELLKIRLALEGLAVEHAASHIRPDELDEVARLHEPCRWKCSARSPMSM